MKQIINKMLFCLRMLLGFNLISLIHLIRIEPRRFFYACNDAFFSARGSLSSALDQIPGVSLDSILGERQPSINMRVLKYEDGMLPNNELMVLLSVLVANSPKVVLEIGTYMGHTTRQMAENLQTAIIHTVDLPEHFSVKNSIKQQLPMDDFHIIKRRIVGREFRGQACECRIKQHFGDTANWDFSSVGHPTFFFIDGSHSYEYCKNDSEKCFNLCKGRGVFLWHDCDERHPGVVNFLLEWRKKGRDIKLIYGTSMAYWKSI